MTEIWFIRHGETTWNAERRLQGWKDAPLNDWGREQAALVAARVRAAAATAPFAALYSSDLQRTQDTAAPVGGQLDLRVRLEPGIRERCYGVLEGLAMDELDEKQPEAAAAWKSREPQRPIEGGETLAQFHARVVATVEDIAARHEGERVLAVTHGGVLDIIWRQASGVGLELPRQAALLNASINRVGVAGRGWEVLEWGNVGHLTAESASDIVP
ncbi:histidine phosphatase family protein [Bordetella petrii]|uniref:histidine phosphatase family protein n=1 Tax=Bordetella petrii TaxID=94624 RepID=UPI001E3FEE8F|nr:histidine phosphatase family protein [Bordetella petrii]MCD0502574.1 histidine phosphatase family protein [Bordetella petrii]